jgi:hypothetical protein
MQINSPVNWRLTRPWEAPFLRKFQNRFQRLVDLLRQRIRQMPDDVQYTPRANSGQVIAFGQRGAVQL